MLYPHFSIFLNPSPNFLQDLLGFKDDVKPIPFHFSSTSTVSYWGRSKQIQISLRLCLFAGKPGPRIPNAGVHAKDAKSQRRFEIENDPLPTILTPGLPSAARGTSRPHLQPGLCRNSCASLARQNRANDRRQAPRDSTFGLPAIWQKLSGSNKPRGIPL